MTVVASGPMTLAQILSKTRAVLDRWPNEEIIGVRADPGGIEPATEDVQIADTTRQIRVEPCLGVLAVREVLRTKADGEILVVVTDCAPTDLGGDVLARLARQRLLAIDNWEIVKELFGALSLDPRLWERRWITDALIEATPAEGYPNVRAGVLDLDTAVSTLFPTRFHLDGARPDPLTLLRWTSEPAHVAAYLAMPEAVRSGVRSWMEEDVGAASAAILRCVETGHGSDAVAVGLVCDVVYSDGAAENVELAAAAVRLESIFGGKAVDAGVGAALAHAAVNLVHQVLESQVPDQTTPPDTWFLRAEQILGEIRAAKYAYLSDTLPLGFSQRMEMCGHALQKAISDDTDAARGEVERTAESVTRHLFARRREDRVEAIHMATRLLRRLTAPGPPSGAPAALVRNYMDDGAWIDWARDCMAGGGDVSTPTADAFAALFDRTTSLQESANREFATKAAGWAGAADRTDVLGVEDILDRVVVPIAASSPVLLVVMDGMSVPVARELASDLRGIGLNELVPQDGGPLAALATLPTVTEGSRASLLAGRLSPGSQDSELRAFAAHDGLRSISMSAKPPVLFHKPDLVGRVGAGLSETVRDAIADSDRKIVGVVVNAVDDTLLKGDQLAIRWLVRNVSPLQQLLEAAHDAGRTVVLTSDHGHVIDRKTDYEKPRKGGERWRPDDGDPDELEVRVAGPRVLDGGGQIIMPWSERIRYGAKRAGYHGGFTLTEVVVPVIVLNRMGAQAPPGWTDAPPCAPDWWDPTDASPEAPAVRVVPGEQTTLFPPPGGAEPEAPPGQPAWIETLVTSDVFTLQETAAARVAPPRERTEAALVALAERGGTMTRTALAKAIGFPEARMPGFLAGLGRILNVDGYPVLVADADSETVTLDRALLETQFGVGDV